LLAYVILFTYLPFAAWAMFRYATVLRQRYHELQLERDRAESARRQSSRALLAVLPESAARELADTGSVTRRVLPDATVLLAGVRWSVGPEFDLAWLGSVLGPCQEILRRHRLELVKTFAGRFVALAAGDSGPDQAVAAAREIAAYFRDHGGAGPDGGSEWPFCLVVHCGLIESGLLQAEPLNFDIVGEAVDEALALAAEWDAPGVLISAVARDRLQGDWSFQPLDEAEASVFLLAERFGGRADLAA
jgi:class 3 adenylate cyclase